VTAGLLAQKGHDVHVLERETFPRYHIGESMITGMLSVVEQLGLSERLAAMGFERKYGISLIWGKERGRWTVAFREAGPYEYAYHVERDRFDALLLDRAAELGAGVTYGAAVREPIVEDGRVAGVRFERDGATHTARAGLVVDASGQARVVARRFSGVQWHDELKNLAVWNYFEGCGRLEGDERGNILIERIDDDGGWFWTIPLGPSRLSVGYVAPTRDMKVTKADAPEFFADKLARSTHTRRLVGEGNPPVDDFRVARDWSYMSDEMWGPGWVTVGDASGFVDPLLSSGVCLGMLCAVPLAQAIDISRRDPSREARLFDRYTAGCRSILGDITQYVLFFYDQQRDREDYYERAASIQQAAVFNTPRAGFVALISGIAGIGPVFSMVDDEQADEPASAAAR
jgi:flavin-dependent dehydrogenase